MAWQDDPVTYTPLGGGQILADWGAGGKFPAGQYIYRQTTTAERLAGYSDPNGFGWFPVAPAPPSAPVAATVATSTGVNPTETSYSLYGHVIPLSVFGLGRIGGEIISGPWVANGAASFCISFGVPADPYGNRNPLEIAFDSEVVWTSTGGFNTEPFTFRWYPGTLTQAADPLETSHFGANAVAYRPQMLLWFEDLPLANTKFQKIPYVACLFEDSSGHDVNLGEAFRRLAYSPWVGYTSAQFDTVGITDGLPAGGLIIAQDAEFLGTIQQFGRFYQNWDILQTDKLRIVDRGAVTTADINLDKTRMSGQVVLSRASQDSVPRTLELSTIDPAADYSIVPSSATRPHVPVNVTTSVATESVFLPMIMDTHTRMSLVTYAKYQEEVARKRVTGTAMMYGLEVEPGDLVALIHLGDDFSNEVFKCIQTTHGVNYAVEFVLESILRCSMVVEDDTDPDWIYVVLLLGFEGVDGSQGAPGFTDESSKHHGTAAIANFPQIDTAQAKFGVSSAWINGTNPVVDFSGSADFDLSSANSDQFTVEAWVRFNSFPSISSSYANAIVGCSYSGVSWFMGVYAPTGGDIELLFSFVPEGGSIQDISAHSSGASLAASVWYHLAVDKDPTGKIRTYVNGVPKGSSIPANSAIQYDSSNDQLLIGAIGVGGGNNRLDGWIDELRISKGIARYQTDRGFTPPTAPFPRGGPL